jgi:hypothetical protein
MDWNGLAWLGFMEWMGMERKGQERIGLAWLHGVEGRGREGTGMAWLGMASWTEKKPNTTFL